MDPQRQYSAVASLMRPFGLLLALSACNGTEPDYPPFDGPAPTVSDVVLGDGVATAIIRDPQGANTVGRTDYTYVYFYMDESTDSHVSFAGEWIWTQVDELTWSVTVPAVDQEWSGSGWHVADEDSNVQTYRCPRSSACVAVDQSPEPPGPI